MGSGIAELVEERAGRDRHGLALIQGRTGDALTNAALAGAVRRWVQQAEAAGVGDGRVVVLTQAPPLDYISAYLGLLAAGAIVLPLDPLSPLGAGDLARIVHGFQISAVASGSAPDLRPTGSEDQARVGWAPPGTVVLRTSGTTGTPKGVLLDQARLLSAAGLVASHHQFSASDIIYSSLPLFHINAQVVGVLASLVSGATLAVDDQFHRRGFWDVLDSCGATVLNAVPAILAILANEPAPPPAVSRRIRFARSASAPLAVATLRWFQDHTGIGVLETYGMTEASGQICANPLDPSRRCPGSVGLPVGIELRVVDEEGHAAPESVPGLVQIRGRTVTDAYVIPGGAHQTPLRLPAPDASSGWLSTGDIAYRDAGGFVHLMGRTDGVINRGGEKLYPREVEEVLRRHPGVAEAVVVGEPDDVLGECPVAFVVPAAPGAPVGPGSALEAELVDLCRRELSRHKRPARFHLAASLPSTATGKVRRDQLRALAPR